MRLMVPSFALWLASWHALFLMHAAGSDQWRYLRLNLGLKFLAVPTEGDKGESGYRVANEVMGVTVWDKPALFFVKSAANVPGQLFELTLRLSIARVKDEVLQMPEVPTHRVVQRVMRAASGNNSKQSR